MERVTPRPTNRAALPYLLTYAQTLALERHLSRLNRMPTLGLAPGRRRRAPWRISLGRPAAPLHSRRSLANHKRGS
jgi:hypothetical protein